MADRILMGGAPEGFDRIEVYTTRPDTLMGASFAAISDAELRIILHPKSEERGNVVLLGQVHQRVHQLVKVMESLHRDEKRYEVAMGVT